MSNYPGKMSHDEGVRLGLTEPLDLRTTDEIEDDIERRLGDLRETLTGLPARPGVTR